MTDCVLHINNHRYSWPFHALQHHTGEFERTIWTYLNEWFTQDEFEVMTSGSTGAPKVIHHQKSAIVWSATSTAKALQLQPKTNALCCLPIEKIAGRMMLYRAIINNWELTLRTPSGMPFIADDQFDFVALTPFQATKTFQAMPSVFNHIGNVILGGAQVLDTLAIALKPFSCAVWETYGMTETISHVALKQLQPLRQTRFYALPDVKLTTNAEDQLLIDAPHLSAQLETNDIVHLVDEQSFELLGRKDDVINSGGIKLFPHTIEAKLAGSIEERFFITKSSDEALGEVVTMVIESAPWNEERKAQLTDHFAKQLDKFERPRKITFQSAFSETDTGKITRKLPS